MRSTTRQRQAMSGRSAGVTSSRCFSPLADCSAAARSTTCFVLASSTSWYTVGALARLMIQGCQPRGRVGPRRIGGKWLHIGPGVAVRRRRCAAAEEHEKSEEQSAHGVHRSRGDATSRRAPLQPAFDPIRGEADSRATPAGAGLEPEATWLRAMTRKAESRTAVVAGPTGLVGSRLLDILLREARYRRVVALSRRSARGRNRNSKSSTPTTIGSITSLTG